MRAFGAIIVLLASLSGKSAGAIEFEQAIAPDPDDRPLQIGIWYPSEGGTETSRLPLVLLSHGTGGAYTDQEPTAVALAEAGFVAVGVTHTGNNFRDNSYVAKARHLIERPRHVARALDYMLASWPAHERIDPQRIGMFGFSAGAFTTLVIIGGEADFSRSDTLCREHPEDWDCPYWKSELASDPKPTWIRDARVRAAVVVAPAAGYMFSPDGLARVRVPVQLWAGMSDRVVNPATHTAVVRKLLPSPPDYHEVEGATHYAFLGPCSPQLQVIMAERSRSGEANVCLDPPGFDRAAFHGRFNREVVAFFSKTLRGNVGTTSDQ